MVLASNPYLIVDAGGRRCALPAGAVRETMRRLPVARVANAPGFVLGVAAIRGGVVPVVDLAALLGAASGQLARFVTLRTGERTVAVAVGAVVGLRTLEEATVAAMPPLLKAGNGSAAEAIGLADGALLHVLNASRLVPDEVWSVLDRGGAADGS